MDESTAIGVMVLTETGILNDSQNKNYAAQRKAVKKNKEYWVLDKDPVYVNGYGISNRVGLGKISVDAEREIERLLKLA